MVEFGKVATYVEEPRTGPNIRSASWSIRAWETIDRTTNKMVKLRRPSDDDADHNRRTQKRRQRRSDDDADHHRRTEKSQRRRLHLLANDCDRGFSMYRLNADDFDSDDSSSEDDVDSRARDLRHRRLVVRLAGEDGQKFLAVGTKVFDFYKSSSPREKANLVFDTRTRLVSAVPPFRAPKRLATFWTVGRTIYALADQPRRSREEATARCCFERLGREPWPGYGEWKWEALPSPPFDLSVVLSHAVHPDGATVFLSVYNTGTFSFDAERRPAWARHGRWLLPFDGEAFFVRELDAWVGLSSKHMGRIAACRAIDATVRRGEKEQQPPACTTGRDMLYHKNLKRHLDHNLTYMGNARFCLQETLTRRRFEDAYNTFGGMVWMLVRIVTFRVEFSDDNELCAVDRRSRVYKLPGHSSEQKPFAFSI